MATWPPLPIKVTKKKLNIFNTCIFPKDSFHTGGTIFASFPNREFFLETDHES